MLTFTRKTLVFNIPDAPESFSSASDAGQIRSALESCAVALKTLDDIEQNLQPLRNFLRFRRDAYFRTRSSLLRVQDYRPFDALPDEMVVEVFKKVLALPAENGREGTPPLDRLTLSQVCRRWKNILESVPCISTPEQCYITVYRQTLESGALASRIYSMARFPGPLRLDIICRVDFYGDAWLQGNIPTLLSEFAIALGAPHRATILLNLFRFPLEVLEYVMMGAGCKVFTRISSLDIREPPFHSARRAAWSTLPSSTPQFPILFHIALELAASISPISIRNEVLAWLLQPTTCDNLLSFSGSFVSSDDISWLLQRVPRLMDLKVSENATALGASRQPIIAHPNLKKLTLGRDYTNSSLHCPNLTTLVQCNPFLPGHTGNLRRDSKLSLIALSICSGLRDNIVSEITPYGPDLSFLVSLCITSILPSGLMQLADLVKSDRLPNLAHLSLQLFPPPQAYFIGAPWSGRLIAPLARIVHDLQVLTQSLSGCSSIQTIDFRLPEQDDNIRILFNMTKLLRHSSDGRPVDLADAASRKDDFFGAYLGHLEEIEKILNVGSLQVPLEDISEKWNVAVTGIQDMHIDNPNVPICQLVTTVPAFWVLFGRLKATFAGTPFPLHEDIIGLWKEKERLAQTSCATTTKKQWTIGASSSPLRGATHSRWSRWQFEGLYYGRQAESLIFDLCQQDHHYFAPHDSLVFSHGMNGAVGGLSKDVLHRLGLRY